VLPVYVLTTVAVIPVSYGEAAAVAVKAAAPDVPTTSSNAGVSSENRGAPFCADLIRASPSLAVYWSITASNKLY